ncbi:MAG TPA: cyclopropane-fatty-acyl-phospholipid synthase family protein [Sphingomonas sp.]|jgi:cyclopropane-fatty-acyl-phospholipid synthase
MGRLDHARAIVAEVACHLKADCSVELWNGERLPLGRGARDDIRIRIGSPAAIGRLVRSPKLVTLVEVYLSGDLDIVGASPLDALQRWDHLDAVNLKRRVDRMLVLRHALPFLTARAPAEPGMRFRDRVRRVAGRGRDDQAMVQFHYDLSNAFYALFLGPTMQYSSAVFDAFDTNLDSAQTAKLDLICRKLRLRPGSKLLDIGCGWGGLAAHAAERFGATVHGVTLSAAQLEAARTLIVERGLEDRVTLELRDYREIEAAGEYDAVAQIGMFEHVGIDNHDRFFEQMACLLKPGGLYLHQATTRRAIRDLSKFRRRTAYMEVINRWIFPGGELDHLGLTATNLERWGFEIRDVESMREHYHLTLKAWSERLYANRDAAAKEVGVTRVRLWLLYLALSCTGFQRGVLCDFQTLAQKRVTGLSGLPLRRE